MNATKCVAVRLTVAIFEVVVCAEAATTHREAAVAEAGRIPEPHRSIMTAGVAAAAAVGGSTFTNRGNVTAQMPAVMMFHRHVSVPPVSVRA